MDKFQVIRPSGLLAPYVKQYWFVTMENVVRGCQRLVPFGYPTLGFYRRPGSYSSLQNDYLPAAHLYGITTNHTNLIFSGNIDFICIVFQPASTGAFFNMPLNEPDNTYISIDSLHDPGWEELGRQLNDIADNLTCVGLIEQFLCRRIRDFNQYNNKRLRAVINSIEKGEADVNRLAETACLGYKQFKRIFRENIGINPKKFIQIVRFQRFHRFLQLRTNKSLTQLAYECGYCDKSHLIKEVKNLSGFTPTRLFEACDSVYSDYHALFRSAFVDLPSGE